MKNMNSDEFIEFAKSQNLTKDQLEETLLSLKENGYGILGCIRFVKFNQNISLYEANDIVLNSKAWISKKDEFIQHQNEMWEEIYESESFKEKVLKNVDSISLEISEKNSELITFHLKKDKDQNKQLD